MANASARNIAPAPTLRSGSPSNLRVRFSRRMAESRYLPRPKVASAGRSPAATKARRRTAPGSPLLSVGVPPVLPSSTSPLIPMILTHTLPSCSEIYRRGCARESSERCDAHRIIYCPGFPFYILERTSPRQSEGLRRPYADSPHVHHPRCYKHKYKGT
jgi:hypothetical protein